MKNFQLFSLLFNIFCSYYYGLLELLCRTKKVVQLMLTICITPFQTWAFWELVCTYGKKSYFWARVKLVSKEMKNLHSFVTPKGPLGAFVGSKWRRFSPLSLRYSFWMRSNFLGRLRNLIIENIYFGRVTISDSIKSFTANEN